MIEIPVKDPLEITKIPETLIRYLAPQTPREREIYEEALFGFITVPKLLYSCIANKKCSTKVANPRYVIEYLAAHLDCKNDVELRDRFILGFLFWTGVRVKELLLTKKKDIDLDARKYDVPTVKRKQLVYITITLNHVPQPEIALWKKYLSKKDGERMVDVSARQIERIVKKALGKAYTPRSLRHSLGVWLAATYGCVGEILRFSNELYELMYDDLADWDYEFLFADWEGMGIDRELLWDWMIENK